MFDCKELYFTIMNNFYYWFGLVVSRVIVFGIVIIGVVLFAEWLERKFHVYAFIRWFFPWRERKDKEYLETLIDYLSKQPDSLSWIQKKHCDFVKRKAEKYLKQI